MYHRQMEGRLREVFFMNQVHFKAGSQDTTTDRPGSKSETSVTGPAASNVFPAAREYLRPETILLAPEPRAENC